MANVRVDPLGESTHDLSLADGVREFGIRLQGGSQGVTEESAEGESNIAAGGVAKFGDFDPSMAEIQMSNWTRGRGHEDWQEGGYYDGQSCWSLTPNRLFQSLQWQISSGLREDERLLPGSVTWQPLLGDQRFIATNFTTSTTFAADKAYMWVRRMGSPGTLTFEKRADNAGAPGTTTISVAVASTSIPDTISRWHEFDWTGTTSVTASSKNHISVFASTADNQANHWEVGVSTASTAAHTSSDGATWAQATYQPYYRVVDADRARKMSMFRLGSSTWFAWSQHDNGTSATEVYRLSTGTVEWTLADFSSGGGLVETIDDVWEDVAVFSSMAAVAAGPSTTIKYLRVSGSSVDMRNDATSTNVADRVHVFNDPVDGPQLWRAKSSVSQLSRAKIPAWAANSTFVPSTGIPLGDQSMNIMEITDHDDQIYARKQDSIWAIKNDRGARIPVGIDAVTETADFLPMLSKDLDLLFGWSHSLEALSGRTLTDIGPWKDAGLPSSRAGPIVALEPGIGMLFCGIDAGTTGVSSVLALTGDGYHEIFRAPVAGMRVQALRWQPLSGAAPRLWVSCGGELYYMTFPRNALNPLRDANVTYQHEGVVETGAIDMEASQLPKLFSEVRLIASNLNSSGVEIRVDYQLDDEIGGSSWIEAGRSVFSPEAGVKIRRGDRHRIGLRFRLITSVATTPTVLVAAVLKAIARTPVKRRWKVLARAGTFQVTAMGLPDHDPDSFYLWAQDAAVTTVPLHMRSRWRVMHDIYVFMEPPSIQREYATPSGEHGELYQFSLREV